MYSETAADLWLPVATKKNKTKQKTNTTLKEQGTIN